MTLGVVILAAGQGSRMQSALPKVLHPLAGTPMLAHVIDTAAQLGPQQIVVVYGHGGEHVREQMATAKVSWALQAKQLGTGHAVAQAMPALDGVDQVLVLYGDVPLIQTETLARLRAATEQAALGMLTVNLANPTGYGRILRDTNGSMQRIIEHKDANAAELAVQEVNVGIMLVQRAALADWLAQLDSNNAQDEFYLTDIVAMAVAAGVDIASVQPTDALEVMGVNDRIQLATLERHYQKCQAAQFMRAGVTIMDPARIDIRGSVKAGRDVVLDINVLLEGEVELEEGVQIGANSVIRNSSIAAGTVVREHCVIDGAQIGTACQIGPFARIRPGTVLAQDCHVGNFVELKNTQVEKASKINHLSYVGDASVGSQVNIGAGTITCNYDGANKHRTVIGNNVFIGSDTQLVAPVTVEDGATIGAGSTITATAPAKALTLSRTKQRTVTGWKRPVKER